MAKPIQLLLILLLSAISVYLTAVESTDFKFQSRISSNLSNSFSRQSVVVSGDTALVSSDDGTYVYVRSGGTWTQQTILVPSDGNAGCPSSFSPLALESDTVVVGCSGKAINGFGNQGAAYVFVRNGTQWSEQQRLLAGDGSANDRFGAAVALSGTTVIISSLTDAVGGNANQGSAYVFVRDGSTWSEQAHLFASDGGSGHALGRSVAIDGNTAVVGRSYNSASSPDNPSVYVFVRTGTSWQQQQRIDGCEPSASGSCRFGYAVSINGDAIVVGNEFLNLGTNISQGGIYYFTRTNSIWTQQQRITADDGSSNDLFGSAVSLSGSDLIVGAPADIGFPGKAYVYTLANGSWSLGQKIMAGQNRNAFGAKLWLDGDSLIVGSQLDEGTGPFIGAAYIYTRTAAHTSFDFDGDGKADPSVFRPDGQGVWYALGSQTGFMGGVAWGLSTDKLVAADYDGDGKTDVAVYRDGTWWVLNSNGGGITQTDWGIATDIPVPADYDGDGKADLAVYRDGTWWVFNWNGGGITQTDWGIATDKPVPADYDGDGKADLAVYRNGTWWVLNSNGGGITQTEWGIATDIPVPADYDGDSKTDIAVYRDGDWWVMKSNGDGATQTNWGIATDKPVPADYDGDGKADLSVYRDGDWWTMKSNGAGFTQTNWGIPTDIPIPRRPAN